MWPGTSHSYRMGMGPEPALILPRKDPGGLSAAQRAWPPLPVCPDSRGHARRKGQRSLPEVKALIQLVCSSSSQDFQLRGFAEASLHWVSVTGHRPAYYSRSSVSDGSHHLLKMTEMILGDQHGGRGDERGADEKDPKQEEERAPQKPGRQDHQWEKHPRVQATRPWKA